jgi:hypothetical protein
MKPNDNPHLVSKVLVLDDDERHHEAIKVFCAENALVPLKAAGGNPMAMLRSNVDLGAVLLWEHFGGGPGKGLELARDIHHARQELPIFLRRDTQPHLGDFDEADQRLFSVAYTAADMTPLRDAIGTALFNRVYPTALVRGITEVTRRAIEGQFRNITVEHEAPCLVKDRIIYGELFSLIPLESNWCRGYMMLQTREQQLLDFIFNDSFGPAGDETNFRALNNLLGETTNMVWGAFKNRFIAAAPDVTRLTQVPIIVNHQHRYISFGAEDPMLCVKYRLYDKRDAARGFVVMYQWFAFSLAWTPDNFAENVSVESLCASGEIEFF